LSFDKTQREATSKDSPKILKIDNIGNAPLKFSSLSYPTDFPMGQSGALADCTTSLSLTAASSCALPINFHPVTKLTGSNSSVLREDVKFATDALNKPNTQSTVPVSGTETAP
jgi:hypothetical protein